MTINALTIRNLRPRNRTGGDCVVLALTFITGAPYADVEDYIKQRHSRYQTPEGTRAYGVHTDKLFKDEFVIFGYRLTRFDTQAFSLGSFIDFHPTGTFFICIPSHALTVKDGQIFDGNDSSPRNHIKQVWKVEKVVA